MTDGEATRMRLAIAQALAILEVHDVDILAECERRGAPELAIYARELAIYAREPGGLVRANAAKIYPAGVLRCCIAGPLRIATVNPDRELKEGDICPCPYNAECDGMIFKGDGWHWNKPEEKT